MSNTHDVAEPLDAASGYLRLKALLTSHEAWITKHRPISYHNARSSGFEWHIRRIQNGITNTIGRGATIKEAKQAASMALQKADNDRTHTRREL